jgi:hypothetical protein
MGLLKVSKHVDWGILNHHVLRVQRVLWPPEMHGVATSRRNVLRKTSSIGAVWMKVEVSFKPFPLRSFASQWLLIHKNQMLWRVAFLRDMRIASTLVAKLSLSKLCSALPFTTLTIWIYDVLWCRRQHTFSLLLAAWLQPEVDHSGPRLHALFHEMHGRSLCPWLM